MDIKIRSSKLAIIMTALFIVSTIPLGSVNATPQEESEFFYGVEYDWSSIDSDLTNFTGLDLPEIFSEVMGAAGDSGFDLIIGQLMTGSSNVYVHYSEDISPQSIKNYDGDQVSVWSRTTDVTLRHGGLIDGILNTDWSEQTFGMEPTSFDIDISSSSQSILSVDMLYTEYLDDSYNLIGADMVFSMDTETSTSLNIDSVFKGDGEELPIDFNVAMSFGYSITDSTSQWRLESPDSVYVDLSANDEYEWDASGDLIGDYDGSIDYSLSVTGIPTEEFGFDSGEFDIEISDLLTQTNGEFEIFGVNGEFEFIMGDDMTIDLDDGDGLTTQVQSCENCPPGNPLMFVMMGNVIGGASESFIDDVGESFSEGLSENLIEIFDISGDDDDDYYDDDQNWFYCDNGERIRVWFQDDGYYDCSDGSDENILVSRLFYSSGEFINSFTIYEQLLDLEEDVAYYTCDDGTIIEWYLLNDESWNNFDCESGEDEYDFEMIEESMFTCDDDSEILLSKVNDGNDDCMDGEDEPEYGDMDINEWYCLEDEVYLPLSDVNNGVVDCSDGLDEPRYEEISEWFCPSDEDYIPLSEVNDGDEETACSGDLDEPQYDSFGIETSEFECENGDIILLSKVNDGNFDCYDGDDEPEYDLDSDLHYFECESGASIFISLVNDGNDDCYDGDDESEFEYDEISEFECDEEGWIILLSMVNDGWEDCGVGIDEPSYSESDIEILYTCSDGSEIFWSQVNDGVGDCADFLDEGIMDKFTLNYNIITEEGNVLHTDSYDMCAQTTVSECEHSIYSQYYYLESSYSPTIDYGEHSLCMNAELIDDSDNEVAASTDIECNDYYEGPHFYNYDLYDEDGYLHFRGSSFQEDYILDDGRDANMEMTIFDPNNQVIFSSTMELEYNYNTLEDMIAISEDGEYCMELELFSAGETTPFNTMQICEEVSSEGEPSDRIEKIASAFSDSSILEVLESFAENLQQRLEDTEPFETFPYNDGLWAPMWSNEHGAIVGVGLYAMDDNGAYTIAGPDTVGYMDDAPAKMSIRYLTGVAASNAANSMESADELDEIVDVEQHDLDQITEELENAGIDTSDLDLPIQNADQNSNSEDSAEQAADDDGLLPFVSPLSVLAVIALAGAIISGRKENE